MFVPVRISFWMYLNCAFETEWSENRWVVGWWDDGGAAITKSGGSLKLAFWMEVTICGEMGCLACALLS